MEYADREIKRILYDLHLIEVIEDIELDGNFDLIKESYKEYYKKLKEYD